MDMARVVAKRGTCDRAHVGAILVNSKNKVVSIGYNGSPSGQPHCDDVGHLMIDGHCIRTVHAEENCLREATLNGDYVMYVTHYPCMKCQSMMYEKLMQSPGTKLLVIYEEGYGKPTAFSQLKEVSKVLQFTRLEDGGSYVMLKM